MGIEELLLDRAQKQGLKQGIEKGLQQGMAEKEREKNTVFTRRLLQSTTFSTAQIAELVGVSEDFVEQVRADLEPGLTP